MPGTGRPSRVTCAPGGVVETTSTPSRIQGAAAKPATATPIPESTPRRTARPAPTRMVRMRSGPSAGGRGAARSTSMSMLLVPSSESGTAPVTGPVVSARATESYTAALCCSATLRSTFMTSASWARAARCRAIRSAYTACICRPRWSWMAECGVGKSTSTSASPNDRASGYRSSGSAASARSTMVSSSLGSRSSMEEGGTTFPRRDWMSDSTSTARWKGFCLVSSS